MIFMGKAGSDMVESKPNSIEKAIEVLLAFIPRNQEMGTGEISQKLGLHKATASRILRTLTKKGLLQQDPDTKKFSLGPTASDMGHAYDNGMLYRLVKLAEPCIEDLRNTVGESSVLEILSGYSTVIGCIAEGPQRVHLAGTVGDRLPVHAAAGAKAILAFLPEDKVERLIGDDLERFTPKTITDLDTFKLELEKIRRRGYSLDREGIDVGINAVGVPIFNHDDKPIAAVVVVGPSQRIKGKSDSAVVMKAKAVAEDIMRRLDYK
jgi:DNA-binding IclR family transcriptional regulator